VKASIAGPVDFLSSPALDPFRGRPGGAARGGRRRGRLRHRPARPTRSPIPPRRSSRTRRGRSTRASSACSSSPPASRSGPASGCSAGRTSGPCWPAESTWCSRIRPTRAGSPRCSGSPPWPSRTTRAWPALPDRSGRAGRLPAARPGGAELLRAGAHHRPVLGRLP
jgi:hypothetical protein